MNPQMFGSRVVVMMALAVATPPAARGDEPAYTIADVKKAWKARQDEAKTFRIEWVETVKVKAGSIPSSGDANNPGPHPPEDHDFSAACSFASDGDRIAMSDERSAYNLPRKTWVPYFRAVSFDGRASMSVNPLARPRWARVNIEVGKERVAWLNSLTNSPVTRIYRPLGGGALQEFDFEKFNLTGRTEKIRGAECVELRVKKPAVMNFVYVIWCDPNRDFLPVRHRSQYDEGEGYILDWEYRKDDQGRWVPVSWEVKRFDDAGKVRMTRKAKVKKLEFGVKFAAGAFAVIPPRSSAVAVYKDGELQEEYLIRPDGSKRPLKSSERNKSYDELIKTNADGTPYVPKKK